MRREDDNEENDTTFNILFISLIILLAMGVLIG